MEPQIGRLRIRPIFLLVLVVAILLAVFLSLAEETPAIADTIGYTYAAEQLVAGNGLRLLDEHNRTVGPYFSMFAFQIRRGFGDALYFGFPPGLPLLLAVGAFVGRVEFVVPLLAAAGVLATYFLGRISTGSAWAAWWAALLLAWVPDYWMFGTAAWSEVPSAAFLATGFVFYLLSRKERTLPGRAILWSVVAAIVLCYSFYLRYANVVTALPAIGLYELFAAGKNILRERWRWPFFLLLGTGVASILAFNDFYYGGMFLTNYSPEHGWYPQPAFSSAYAFGSSFVNGHSFQAVILALWDNFGPLLVLLPVGWLGMQRGPRILSAVAAAATVALYTVYAFAAEGINSRFLLPAYPFITVAIGAALGVLGQRLPAARLRYAGGLLLLAFLSLAVPERIQLLTARNAASASLVAKVEEITGGAEQDAVFLSYGYNDAIIYYADRSVLNYRRIPPSDPVEGRYRWELLGPCMDLMVARLLDKGAPVYYVEDQTPSFAGSLDKLQSVFALELVGNNPPLYRLAIDDTKRSTLESMTCPLLTRN